MFKPGDRVLVFIRLAPEHPAHNKTGVVLSYSPIPDCFEIKFDYDGHTQPINHQHLSIFDPSPFAMSLREYISRELSHD